MNAGFEDLLRHGKLSATRCLACGHLSFPPRGDCPLCLANQWEWVNLSGRARLYSFTTIYSSPAGFEAPYIVGIADLEEGGRLLAHFPRGTSEQDIQIGMPLQVEFRAEGYELRKSLGPQSD